MALRFNKSPLIGAFFYYLYPKRLEYKRDIFWERKRMADYKILEANSEYNTRQYLVDEEADLSSLPSSKVGSLALVAATADVYILNNKKEWVKL